MRPDEMDAARLWDMLTYARDICDRTAGMTLAEYVADADRRLATERRLEIIGEAARNVSPSFRDAHPEIPWRSIIGLRNVLAHEYGELRQERIFRIVHNDVPALVRVLEPLVPPPPEAEE
jgi:uncharacterized protein with HEPN domain